MAIFPITISVRLQVCKQSIAVLQFMMAHKRLSLFEALQALQDDDFCDKNTGGISTDEKDDLDWLLGFDRRCLKTSFLRFLLGFSWLACAYI